MRSWCKTIAVLGALMVSACADETKTASGATAMQAVPFLGELPMQDLGRGQCALVLWAQRASPQRLLVTLNQPAVARIEVEGKTIELARVAQSGQPLFGQYPETRYRGEGLSLGVSFTIDTAKGLNGGAVVSSAVVEYVDAKGWMTIIPTAGLIGCQT